MKPGEPYERPAGVQRREGTDGNTECLCSKCEKRDAYGCCFGDRPGPYLFVCSKCLEAKK